MNELKCLINETLEHIKLQGLCIYFKNNYPIQYKEIISITNELGYDNMSFTERIWQIIHDLPGRPICIKLKDSCIKELKFVNFNIGYQKYCNRCYTKSKEFSDTMSLIQKNRSVENETLRRQKIKQTNIKKYGATTPLLLKRVQDLSKKIRKIKKQLKTNKLNIYLDQNINSSTPSIYINDNILHIFKGDN